MRNLLCLLALLVTLQLSAQEWTVPKNLTLETEADYRSHEKSVIDAVEYLYSLPPNQEATKRQATNAYLIQWLTGTPTVSLALYAELSDYGDCADCLVLYMGSYAQTAILKPDTPDASNHYTALKRVLNYYEANREVIGKQKPLEKLLKLQAKGKLKAYVEKALG